MLEIFDFLAQGTLTLSHQDYYVCDTQLGKPHIAAKRGTACRQDIIKEIDTFKFV